MYKDYRFRFKVQKVEEISLQQDSRMVTVENKVFTADQEILFQGNIRVEINKIGIYPQPADLKAVPLPASLVRLLTVELKRYIKPQRKFLTPGLYV
ncbi:hypothetical protein [Bacillus sp. 2205SS5-2]|uniref:hypothetical protein n=1 Tax=Bacillus sp. 2205SS5-2 TaxID=3109031 RepID=UPI0030064FE6